jgi:hypothetical protein
VKASGDGGHGNRVGPNGLADIVRTGLPNRPHLSLRTVGEGGQIFAGMGSDQANWLML